MADCLRQRMFIVFLCLLSAAFSFEIGFNTVQSCKESNKYFQVSNLQCVDCNQATSPPTVDSSVISADGFSCTCKPGFYITEYFGGPTVTCSSCDRNKATSKDGWFCLSCQNGAKAVNGICDACPENRIAVERELNGGQRDPRTCLKCETGTALYQREGFCQKCPSCGISFNDPVKPKMFEITYDNGVELESAFFAQNFVIAKKLCRDKLNYTACQLLGNLCVMLDYKNEVDNACREYLDLVNSPPGGQKKVQSKEGVENANWPEYMPWLYYINSQQDADVELNSEDILIKFRTGQSLPFVLAVYTTNGTFLGLKTDVSELQLCQDRPSRVAAADKFATLYENKCDLSLADLWQQKKMLFYDLYFKVTSDTLYAAPLVLENFKERGSSVNKGDSFKSWKLLRRFFLVDNVSGRPKMANKNAKVTANEKQVIRIAEKVEIEFRLRNSKGQIFPPYIRIRYKTMTVNEDILKRKPVVSVSFRVNYQMDTSSISRDVKVM